MEMSIDLFIISLLITITETIDCKICATNYMVNSAYPLNMFFHENKLSEDNASTFQFT